MQKHLTPQEVAAARRKNTMMLAILFAIIATLMIFAFGFQILYVIALVGIPLIMMGIREEVVTQYVAKKPQQKAHM